MRIGFIGLGNMGGGMAANLAKAGHEVHAFDLAPAALERAKDNGCTPHDTARAAAEGADVVITMLPNGGIVKSVVTAEVFGVAPKGALLIDSSTIDVATTRELGESAAAQGYRFVDAPVSGGIAAANGGTLAFMVGGADADFAAAEVVLDPMAKAVIHAGGIGAGQVAKMCNNMILGATMIVTCEAFAMAQKLGLDAQTFFDISSKATGQSWSMTSYCPVPGVGPQSPSDNGYQGGFAAALMLKDLKLAMAAAQDAGAKVEMGALAEKVYAQFAEAGHGGMDFSGIITAL
jgi:3-hydroxyisobutyrate dehydrogenase